MHITVYKIQVHTVYSPGNSTEYSVMAYMGKESKKEWIYVYVWIYGYMYMNQFAIYVKLTQYCKSTILQHKLIFKNKQKKKKAKKVKLG